MSLVTSSFYTMYPLPQTPRCYYDDTDMRMCPGDVVRIRILCGNSNDSSLQLQFLTRPIFCRITIGIEKLTRLIEQPMFVIVRCGFLWQKTENDISTNTDKNIVSSTLCFVRHTTRYCKDLSKSIKSWMLRYFHKSCCMRPYTGCGSITSFFQNLIKLIVWIRTFLFFL